MAPTGLVIEQRPNSNHELVIKRLEGKLVLETVRDFIASLRPEPAKHLILDMSGVKHLDSAGVGALVSLFVSRRGAGRTFALAGLTRQGHAVIQVSGLLNLLPTYGTMEEATAAKA